MARAKLNQGEIAGIRLLADFFVVSGLIDVLAEDQRLHQHIPKLKQQLNKSVPKVFAAEVELQKQIKEVREYWQHELGGKFNGK
ncbi:hypothetical protein ACSMFS_02740 [Shewanella xiamenensis]|uniref:hypothetical protein n=1 Tax=Shewanella xiamenensis TaxID=332186 RepID=UPI003F1CE573